MSCKNIRNYIERYIDKSLSVKKRTDIESHLGECSKCASSYQESLSTGKIITGNHLPAIPDDLTESIMSEVRKTKAAHEKQGDIGTYLIRWWNGSPLSGRAAFAVIILIIMAAGVFIGKDLTYVPEVSLNPEYSELDAFSATPEGSLEQAVFQMTFMHSIKEDK